MELHQDVAKILFSEEALKQRVKEIAGEINGYKQQLEQSDYKVMKAVERIFSASSITDLLSAIAAAAKEVAEIISQRQTWRDRINELEAMEPDQPEAPQE